MAKLEDLVTPSEILDVMKDGAIKADLIKRFKTSDADLAKMLLPLYRNGQLTKDEFNNFFQGLPIVPPEPSPEVSAPAPSPEREAPTLEVPVLPPQVAEAPEPAPPPVPDEAPTEEEEAPAEVEELPESAPEAATIETLPDEEEVELVPELPAAPPAVEEEPPLPSAVLEMILARLSSIDNRLATIEKKLG